MSFLKKILKTISNLLSSHDLEDLKEELTQAVFHELVGLFFHLEIKHTAQNDLMIKYAHLEQSMLTRNQNLKDFWIELK